LILSILKNYKLKIVVLSGGAGTRLWPASREGHPKPFMKLADGDTLIRKTYARAKSISEDVITVTNRDYYFMSRDEQELAGLKGKFLLEPLGRNTSPAIAIAAKAIAELDGPDTVILVLAADHLIADQKKFKDAVSKSVRLALEGYLVTFGIVPTAPETGFGYVELGESLLDGYKVAQFVEKPDFETAQRYLSSGDYLWNSGMFCFKAGAFLDELDICAPEVSQLAKECLEEIGTLNSSDVAEIPEKIFKKMPDISIDHAVMERSTKVAVIPGNFGWNDIGSWGAIRDLVKPDSSQNRALGDVLFVDTHSTFVQSEDRLVATVGVDNLIIIDTPDALLVAHPDKAQDVKKVAVHLKNNNHIASNHHRTVLRPWGSYTVLEDAPGFKIKRIEVKSGASLSLQMHHHRSEHWVVVSGTAKITNGDSETFIQRNESTYIPAGQKHRLENPGQDLCVMIEVQCGSYLGEDDIVRFDDQYGR
jgi:mannose-1-phosphate guanylyltransferase / mannose-6-phosphate isomerase